MSILDLVILRDLLALMSDCSISMHLHCRWHVPKRPSIGLHSLVSFPFPDVFLESAIENGAMYRHSESSNV